MPHVTYLTAEELARNPVEDKRTELVRGRLVVREPGGWSHGGVAARALAAIAIYLESNPLGEVVAAETGFTLARRPDTVRAPDVAFVRNERVPASTHDEIVFAELAPDLVIEVRSLRDRAGMLRVKVADWLRAGVRLVWLIDPRKRSAQVFRADGSTVTLTVDEALDGEDVLPGLRVPLRRLLSR